jgi:hypothetical protein
MWRFAFLFLASCDFVFTLKDPGESTPDAIPPGKFAHLPGTIDVGDVDVQLTGSVLIDTTTQLVTPGIAVVLEEAVQLLPGPSIVVLQANTVAISGNVRVQGSRPFAIVARSITLETGGVLDVSAMRSTSGAGARPGDGPGAGGGGRADFPNASGIYGSGGGGGGFAEAGGEGGSAAIGGACTESALGGLGGTAYGVPELDVLEGGAPGGSNTDACSTKGGGGGGAIQLSASDMLVIAGAITAGGGGGHGGVTCGGAADGGGGGGAGGAIYLEAPMIELSGVLAANGGGGGGGGCMDLMTGMTGMDGPIAFGVASGGSPAPGGCAGGGGAGGGTDPLGARVAPVVGSKNAQCSNSFGGGGGGSAGRIVLRGTVMGNGITSPESLRLPN